MAEKRVETLQIKGMARHVNEINSVQGTTQELINMKPWNGALVPVQAKKRVIEAISADMSVLFDITTHVVTLEDGAVTRYYFAYYDRDRKIVRWTEADSVISEVFVLEAGDDFTSIATLNNIVIVNTTERVERYIFKDGQYVHLPELVMPYIWVEPKEIRMRSAAGSTIEEIIGDFYKLVSEDKKENRILGYMFMRFAFRLYDGNYIKPTQPFFVQCYESHEDTPNVQKYYTTGQRKTVQLERTRQNYDNYLIYALFYKLGYKFEVSTEIQSILSAYDGVVQSIDIFSTRIFQHYDLSNLEDDISFATNVDYPLPATGLSIKDNFESDGNYYKIAEITLDKLIDNTTGEDEIDLTDEITAKTRMPADNYTHHLISGIEKLNYNSRIHFANTIQSLGNPLWCKPMYYYYQDYSDDIEEGGLLVGNMLLRTVTPSITRYPLATDENFWTKYRVWMLVEVKTFNGTKIVREDITNKIPITSSEDSQQWFNTNTDRIITFLNLDSIISYPDSRAKSLSIYLENTDVQEFMKLDTIELKSHDYLNLAYYVNEDLYRFENEFVGRNDENNNELNHIRYGIVDDWSLNQSFYWNPVLTDLPDENRILRDKNRVQLSELDNPFVFPAENSYQIGTQADEITAIGTSVEAISEGQFGMFPLYVFTKQGVWLMQQGGTGTQYGNIVPVSRIRARGLNVTPTKSGVAFISEEGVHIITGREQVNISKTLRNFDYDFKLSEGDDYNNILSDTDLGGIIDGSTFLDYLDGDIAIAYDTVDEEVYVCNVVKNFSYVFQLESRNWYKSSLSFRHVVDNQPGFLVSVNTKFYDIEKRDDAVLWRDVFVQTNPLTLNSMWKKKLTKLFLRCNILNYAGEPLKLHILASNNLYTWQEVNSITDFDGEVHDIKMKRLRASYKYFVFIIEGNIKINYSDITALQMEVEDKFTNKLR